MFVFWGVCVVGVCGFVVLFGSVCGICLAMVGLLLVYVWFTIGLCLFFWFTFSLSLEGVWFVLGFMFGAFLVYMWFMFGALIYLWFTFGLSLVYVWFISGSRLVYVGFKFGCVPCCLFSGFTLGFVFCWFMCWFVVGVFLLLVSSCCCLRVAYVELTFGLFLCSFHVWCLFGLLLCLFLAFELSVFVDALLCHVLFILGVVFVWLRLVYVWFVRFMLG